MIKRKYTGFGGGRGLKAWALQTRPKSTDYVGGRTCLSSANSRLDSLPDSAIGLWFQQQNMVKRVCHRETTGKVHTGIGQKFQVANCKTSLVDATREVKRSPQGDQEFCPGTDLCMASLSEVTTIRTLSGVRDVTSALNCTCIPREKDCQRMSSEQVFFRGTKYETRVDVGQCIGKCRSRGPREVECKPTSSKTVTVMGPNGAKCVEVIQSCSCERKCYRVSHNEAIQVQHNNTTLTKMIDVGRCVGTCSGHAKGECLYWINNRDGSGLKTRHCAIRTKTRPKECYPEFTREQTVGEKTLTVIDSCACR
ncbi:hypothetical protein OS493_020360 [Desmophyllum pertusum]|uniref:Uncharacterized protein n=1 Tax=Desmophyllum pertusum TaxID=174260 RepID=A0A9W9ZN54_9CNID|nr:hypothetical protein OS493_020360 [Desmophyllum pertusum]